MGKLRNTDGSLVKVAMMALHEAKAVADNPGDFDARDWRRAKERLEKTGYGQTERSYVRLQRRLQNLDNHLMNAKQSFIDGRFIGTD